MASSNCLAVVADDLVNVVVDAYLILKIGYIFDSSEMTTIRINLTDHETSTAIVDDAETWYRAKYVATLLGYRDTQPTVRVTVLMVNRRQLKDVKPKEKYGNNEITYVFIHETGLRSLLLTSHLPNASEVAEQFLEYQNKITSKNK